jgi:hypothetical protein
MLFAVSKNKAEHITVGLCAGCLHATRVLSRKGSIFYLCQLSAVDSRFVKYPVLPVRSCPGYVREADQDLENT